MSCSRFHEAARCLLPAVILAFSLMCRGVPAQDDQPPCLQVGDGQVDIGGFALRVKSLGNLCPPTIVLVSGLGDSGLWSWAPVTDQLAAKALTVVFDRAGHGSSEAGPPPRSMEAVVGELHTLLVA